VCIKIYLFTIRSTNSLSVKKRANVTSCRFASTCPYSVVLVRRQESHHEMRIPESDVNYYLFTYLRLSIDNH